MKATSAPAAASPGIAPAGTASPGAAFWSLDQHRAQIEDVLDAIDTGRSPAVSGEDGLRVLDLVEAVYRSSSSGRTEPLPSVG